jgi:hypothetical protein
MLASSMTRGMDDYSQRHGSAAIGGATMSIVLVYAHIEVLRISAWANIILSA